MAKKGNKNEAMTMRIKSFTIVLATTLALAALALPARADFGLTVNGADIACASGEGWTFDGATVSLTNAGPFVLSTTGESSFTSNVAVVAQADCAVTFSHIEIFAGNHIGLSPFTVAPGVSVTLTLDGNAVLTAGSGAAAITVVSNATGIASLTIDADATDTFHTLGVTGGSQGAGIGGGDGETCGDGESCGQNGSCGQNEVCADGQNRAQHAPDPVRKGGAG